MSHPIHHHMTHHVTYHITYHMTHFIKKLRKNERTAISLETLEHLSEYLEKQKKLPPEVENRIPIASFIDSESESIGTSRTQSESIELENAMSESDDQEDEIAVLDCEIEI